MTREMTQTLRLQWLATRWLLVPLVLVCIGLPQVVVRMSVHFASRAGREGNSEALIQSLDSLSSVFPFLAAITGAAIALAAWNWDHRTNHIYALSLPLSRGRYALLKLWSGAVILLVPTLAIWIGALIATSSVPIPDGLRTYPFAFGARFLLAGVLVYATMFAMAAGTIRTTMIISLGIVLVLSLSAIGIPLLESNFNVDLITPLELVWDTVSRWPGPFEVFAGNWLLIDV